MEDEKHNSMTSKFIEYLPKQLIKKLDIQTLIQLKSHKIQQEMENKLIEILNQYLDNESLCVYELTIIKSFICFLEINQADSFQDTLNYLEMKWSDPIVILQSNQIKKPEFDLQKYHEQLFQNDQKAENLQITQTKIYTLNQKEQEWKVQIIALHILVQEKQLKYLQINDYKFYQVGNISFYDKNNIKRIHYRCLKYKLQVTLNNQFKRIGNKKIEHKCLLSSHEVKELNSNLGNQIINQIKCLVEKIPLKSCQYIYKMFTVEFKNEKVSFSQFKSLSKQIKETIIPNFDDFQFDKILFYSEGFVIEALIVTLDNETKIPCLILISQMGALALSRAEQCNIDFTFQYSPKGFKQLGALCVQDDILGANRIVAYFLTNSKAQPVYEKLFQSLIDCLNNKYKITLQLKINSYYGHGNNSLKCMEDQMRTQIRSCFFHVVKNIWEYAQYYGLKKKNLLFYTSLIIKNFKVALHIIEKENQYEYISKMKQIIIDQNDYFIPEVYIGIYIRLNLYKKFILFIQNKNHFSLKIQLLTSI